MRDMILSSTASPFPTRKDEIDIINKVMFLSATIAWFLGIAYIFKLKLSIFFAIGYNAVL